MKTLRQYNPGLLIPLIVAVAIVIVLALALSAAPQGKNGFNRRFTATPLQLSGAIDKAPTITSFAGTKTGHIYFATRNSSMLFVTDSNLANGRTEASGFTISHPKALRGFTLTVTDSGSTLYAGNLPAIYTLGVQPDPDSFNLTHHLFTRAVLADSGYYVFRAFNPFDKHTRDQVLLKARPGKGITIIDSTTIPRLHDAGIATDGMLHYDTLNKLLVYVSYYSNKVYLWNHQLQLIKSARTIDTLSTQPYFTGEKNESVNRSTLTNIKPKRVINAESNVAGGILYVLSRIKADNETNGGFKDNTVVDCYQLNHLKYISSFYLPNYKGEKIWSIGIAGSSLLAIYRNSIVQYALPTL